MSDENAVWVDGLTIGAVLSRTASRFGDRDAIVFPAAGRRQTWREFEEEVRAVACSLEALGISSGDHVAVWATNVPEWVVLQFATASIGAVLVTVNPSYRPAELAYVLEQSDAVALFLVERFRSSDYFEILQEVCPDLGDHPNGAVSANFPRLRHVIAINGSAPSGVMSWAGMRAAGDTPQSTHRPTPVATDAINIQYTSGTTGFPKAAMLSHRNLLLNAYHIGARQGMTADDRICIPVPFYHCFGCVLGTLCAAVYGAAMIVPAEYFQALATLAAIERERATVVYGVPTMFIAMLEEPSAAARDLTSLRTGIMAGSPCPVEIMKQVIECLGAREITIAYGLTEASPVITQTRADDPLDLRVETVGTPLPGLDVKIVDPETQAEMSDGQQGELCTRGHGVMLGYYRNAEATAAAIDPGGWLHSGDLAVRLPSGYYRITGRIKDMVIRGGENIYPREIEEYLFTHPAVEQAAVCGVPDDRYGEELCLWARLKAGASATEDELREFCRAGLAHFKTPRYVKLVDNFPQTVTGKIQKFRIREMMVDELRQAEQ